MKDPKTILILGDSLSFMTQDALHMGRHPLLVGPRIAHHLSLQSGELWVAAVNAGSGRTLSDLPRRLATDCRLAQQVQESAAIVVALGSCDTFKTAAPAEIRRLAHRHLPAGAVRRILRPIARVSQPLWRGRSAPHVSSVAQVRTACAASFAKLEQLAPDRPMAIFLPAIPTGYQRVFAFDPSHHAKCVDAIIDVARVIGVPTVDLPQLIRPWVNRTGGGDHLHWPTALHDEIATVTADGLLKGPSPAAK